MAGVHDLAFFKSAKRALHKHLLLSGLGKFSGNNKDYYNRQPRFCPLSFFRLLQEERQESVPVLAAEKVYAGAQMVADVPLLEHVADLRRTVAAGKTGFAVCFIDFTHGAAGKEF